jgi:hypothetical protein
MKTFPIGNSKDIRIPNILPEECNIRKDWEDSFKKMKELNDDCLIIDDNIDPDMENWEW